MEYLKDQFEKLPVTIFATGFLTGHQSYAIIWFYLKRLKIQNALNQLLKAFLICFEI